MACASGPSVVTDGLVLDLDAGNSVESAKGMNNILDLSTWTLGTGGTSNFTMNGTTAENQRILDTGPFGVSTVVWDTPSNDVTSDADGGWNTGFIPIDSTKLYRFSVWIRRKIIGNGTYYLGTYGYNASNVNEGVLARSTGAVTTNLYFSASTWPASILANEWMLVVGHVWPAGSGTGSNNPDSGLWNTAGTKFSGSTSTGDAVWQATNTKTIHRSYLYYSTDATTNQQWYQPRIDLCDGTEPSIAELIAGVGSEWYDISGNSNNGALINGTIYNSTDGGTMVFDGVSEYVAVANSSSLNTLNNTLICWAKSTTPTWSANGCLMSKRDVFVMHPNISATTVSYYYYLNGAYVAAGTGAVSDITQWNMYACSWDGTTINAYLNGALVSSVAATGPLAISDTGSLYIGWDDGVAGRYLNGNISMCQQYNRALTATEVQQNFNAFRGRFGV